MMHSKWAVIAEPALQEDRDAAAAAEREEKRRLELQRQQDEQQAQEQELQQLQVFFSTQHTQPLRSLTRSRLPSTRYKRNLRRRLAMPITVRAPLLKLCFFALIFCEVRASLRQLEHRLQEEALRIQQLVEEFKLKQKTIGAQFPTFSSFFM
jgi:hypothetical protein